MRSILILSLFMTGILATPSLSAGTASPDSMRVTLPDIIVSNTDVNINIVLYKDGEVMHDYSEEGRVRVNGEVEYL
ncbi:MAG: hypothetical protein ACOCXO_03505, partial [Bacteroidota bacterium]